MFGKKDNKKELNTEIMPQAINQDKEAQIKQVQEINNKYNRHKVDATDLDGYDIELWDVWDTTSQRKPVFQAKRIIENNNVYLFSQNPYFKEMFPENSEEYKQYKLDELDERIASIEKSIKQVNAGKLDWSLKDLKKELRITKGYKRSLELQGRGSYMVLNSNGRRMFMFDRIGNLKMPLYKNVDRSLIYTPTEQKTQEVIQLLKENKDKNGQEQMIKLSTYGILILMLLTLCFMIFIGYKMSNLPLDVTDNLASIGNALAEVTKDLNNVSSSINYIAETSGETIPKVEPGKQTVTGR